MQPLIRKFQTAEALHHLLTTDFADSLEIQFHLKTQKVELSNLEPGLDAFIEYARLKIQIEFSPSDLES
ncbi:hypothetical protein A4S05_23555 [Nostoc sp. KVJ20]|uniref:hypothetical protein n=1 Tax=Nostoc sp. KVJ20 TaxID=457944 RepID=UPI00083DACD7|nr:hypothetical protein [Nostoc sp. KVJ20]ODH02590.1 hypothetical protein A4S05_23555 [Nostoc sp. KVJ20]